MPLLNCYGIYLRCKQCWTCLLSAIHMFYWYVQQYDMWETSLTYKFLEPKFHSIWKPKDLAISNIRILAFTSINDLDLCQWPWPLLQATSGSPCCVITVTGSESSRWFPAANSRCLTLRCRKRGPSQAGRWRCVAIASPSRVSMASTSAASRGLCSSWTSRSCTLRPRRRRLSTTVSLELLYLVIG